MQLRTVAQRYGILADSSDERLKKVIAANRKCIVIVLNTHC
jgi:hypothetical protein